MESAAQRAAAKDWASAMASTVPKAAMPVSTKKSNATTEFLYTRATVTLGTTLQKYGFPFVFLVSVALCCGSLFSPDQDQFCFDYACAAARLRDAA